MFSNILLRCGCVNRLMPTNDAGSVPSLSFSIEQTIISINIHRPRITMKFLSLLLLCFTVSSEAVFPLKQVLSKIASSPSSGVPDMQSTFEKAKALLMTLPIEEHFHSFLEKIPADRSSVVQALLNLKSSCSMMMQSTSSTQWTMLISSMAPIGLLEKIISLTLGKSLSFEQQAILRAIVQEYQALARVLVATMTLPETCHKAVWIAYAASKVLPQQSILSVFASAMALRRRVETSVGAVVTGMAVGVPLVFHAARTIATVNTPQPKPVLELAECVLSPGSHQKVAIGTSVVRENTSVALQASLASVPLERLLGRRRRATTTTPVVQFWRIGTSPQFWQGIYHAVKQDEYYCLFEDEPVKESVPLA